VPDGVEVLHDLFGNLGMEPNNQVTKDELIQSAIVLELRNPLAVTLEVGEQVASLLEVLDRVRELWLTPGTGVEDLSAVMFDQTVDNLGRAVGVG
jgi:hypothetical protein